MINCATIYKGFLLNIIECLTSGLRWNFDTLSCQLWFSYPHAEAVQEAPRIRSWELLVTWNVWKTEINQSSVGAGENRRNSSARRAGSRGKSGHQPDSQTRWVSESLPCAPSSAQLEPNPNCCDRGRGEGRCVETPRSYPGEIFATPQRLANQSCRSPKRLFIYVADVQN